MPHMYKGVIMPASDNILLFYLGPLEAVKVSTRFPNPGIATKIS